MVIKPNLPSMTPSSFSTEVEKWCHYFHSYLVILNSSLPFPFSPLSREWSHGFFNIFPLKCLCYWVLVFISYPRSRHSAIRIFMLTPVAVEFYLLYFLCVVLLEKRKDYFTFSNSVLQCFSFLKYQIVWLRVFKFLQYLIPITSSKQLVSNSSKVSLVLDRLNNPTLSPNQ